LQQIGEALLPVLEEAIPMPKATVFRSIGRSPDKLFPSLLSSRQVRRNLIFPALLAVHFYYAGRFMTTRAGEPVPCAELLNGKPLIYALLATLVNGLDHVYKAIVEAEQRFRGSVSPFVGNPSIPMNCGLSPMRLSFAQRQLDC